ncbi:MAG: ABC transporter permease [Actinomycetota bacterium]|nr:ABC transporter permease [Actinomycetota bacterium]
MALTADSTAALRAKAQGRVRWELLTLLVRKDLKVKYQGSALGFAWSLATPLLLMGIYYLIFGIVMDNGVPAFAIYLMAGLLPWTAFSSAVTTASGSVVGNAGLVKKVRFPLQVLPLSAVGYAAVHFLMQIGVLVAVVAVVGHDMYSPGLLLLIPALALLILFTTALAYLVAALNVRYRDTSHLVEVSMLVWFWANPILYASGFVKTKLDHHHLFWAYFLNPMATVVTCFQRAIYNIATYRDRGGVRVLTEPDPGYLFYVRNLGIGFLIAGLLFLLARRVFRRLEADFAEEL